MFVCRPISFRDSYCYISYELSQRGFLWEVSLGLPPQRFIANLDLCQIICRSKIPNPGTSVQEM